MADPIVFDERLRLSDRLGWLEEDTSASPPRPCRAVLTFDPADRRVWVSQRVGIDGTPIALSLGRLLWWGLPPSLDAVEAGRGIVAAEPLFQRIADGYREDWDGSNLVGRYSEDAKQAINEVDDLIATLPDLPDDGGWAEAAGFVDDWDILGLTASSTEEEIEAAVEELDRFARENDIVLLGLRGEVEHHVRWLREQEGEDG